MKSFLLESQVCPRCSGTGNYGPYCVNGGRCFKCGGAGAVLTKRGARAQAWLNASRRKDVSAFKPGELILFEGFAAGSYVQPSQWARVASVEGRRLEAIATKPGPDGKCDSLSAKGGVYRQGFDAETKRAQQLDALALQAILTKVGKLPRRLDINL